MSGDGNGTVEMTAGEAAAHLRGVADQRRLALQAWSSDPVELFKGDWQLDLTVPACPDRMPGPADLIDATLVKVRVGRGGLRESTRQRFTDRAALERHLKGYPQKLRESWQYDRFASGWDGRGGGFGGIRDQYVPLLPGPVTRQLYWADYFAMSAKAFEAYNHDPITWRAVQLQQEFILGKGVQVRVKYSSGSQVGQTHQAGQAVWDEFWKRNGMEKWRLAAIVRDAGVLGEQFLRYFPVPGSPKKLTVRSLDPASIYDIITDPEDFETVYAYHQQFQTPYQLYAPQQSSPGRGQPPAPTGPSTPGQITKYVVRQILPEEVDHYRLNVSNAERRGRSDLFPALSWIQRLRVYLTSKVVRQDMLSRIAWDLAVSGNQSDISTTRQLLFPNGQAPPPGTVFAHSDTAILSAVDPGQDVTGSAVDPTFIALANMVCLGPGVPVDYLLQVMRGGTRANALVATEPVAKRLDDRQSWIANGILSDMGDRVLAKAGISNAELEITFPPIASENSTQTLQDLSFAEANGWVAKKTSASRAAAVLGIDSYDYQQEQDAIDGEFEDAEMEDVPGAPADPVTGVVPQRQKTGTGRRSMIIGTNRQAAKLDPAKVPQMDDEMPGLLVPLGEPGTVPPGGGSPGPGSPSLGLSGQGAVPGRPRPTPATAPTRGGVPSTENPAGAAGASAIRGAGGTVRASDDPLLEVLGELRDEMRRMRETRRRPDDPAFLAAAEEYRRQSAAHLQQLVRDGGDR